MNGLIDLKNIVFNAINSFIEQQLLAEISSKGIDRVAAQAYLSNMDLIRVFVADGPGFGNHACPIYIMDYMRRVLGFKGTFEIIGKDQHEKRYKHLISEPLPIEKMASLLGLTWQNITVTEELPDIGKVRLRGLSQFWQKKNLGDEAKIDLSIFVGVTSDLWSQYQVGFSPFAESATSIANSHRAILFNPRNDDIFTFPFYSDYGINLQEEGKAAVAYLRARLLPYLPQQPSSAAIIPALTHLQNKEPYCGASVENLLNEVERPVTFMIYGINKAFHKNQHHTLLPLIIAGMQKAQEQGSSLVIGLLNSIDQVAWQQLQIDLASSSIPALNETLQTLHISTKIAYVDTKAAALPAELAKNTVYLLRLCTLPKVLFDKLFAASTYPPVYEGTNAAASLLSVGRYGIHCSSGKMSEYGLPWDIANSGVCTDLPPHKIWSSNHSLFSNPAPVDTALALINKYQDLPRPIPEFDRVSYALSEISARPQCSESWLLECGIRPAAVLWGETAVKGLGYGIGKEFLYRFLRLSFSCSKPVAETLANLILLSSVALIENDSVRAAAYQMAGAAIFNSLVAINFVCHGMKQVAKDAFSLLFPAGFFLLNFLCHQSGELVVGLVWSLLLTVTSLVSQSYGRELSAALGRKLENGVDILYNTARTWLNNPEARVEPVGDLEIK